MNIHDLIMLHKIGINVHITNDLVAFIIVFVENEGYICYQ